jgi:hypothetical protein
MNEVLQVLQNNSNTAYLAKCNLYLAGSTAINGHGNDLDVVLDCGYGDIHEAAYALKAAGWEVSDEEAYRGISSDGWFSARRLDVNLLVSLPEVTQLWNTATEVCKTYVQLVGRESTREERVALHKAVFGDE